MASALSIVKQYFPKVTKVNDADANVNIEVTNADNKSALVRNHGQCAMAVACKRKMHLDGVIVSIHTVYTVKNNVATRYTVPESLSREIVSFDREAGFAVGEYQLTKPGKQQRLGYQRSGSEGGSGRTGIGNMKKRFKHYTTGIRSALGSKVDVRH